MREQELKDIVLQRYIKKTREKDILYSHTMFDDTDDASRQLNQSYWRSAVDTWLELYNILLNFGFTAEELNKIERNIISERI